MQPEKKRLCFEVSPMWTIIFLYVVLAGVFAVLAIGGILGPKAIEVVDDKVLTLEPAVFRQVLNGESPLHGSFDDLSVFNDEIIFTMTIFPNESLIKSIGFEDILELEIQLKGKDSQNKVHDLTPSTSTTTTVHKRELICHQGQPTCQPVTLFQLPFVAYGSYETKITFKNQQKQAELDFFQPKFYFSYMSMNDSFVKFEIAFRYIFLFFNILVFALFIGYTRFKQPFSVWHTEQKWIAFILAFLILYNNPAYIFQYIADVWLFSLLNILFRVSYVSLILFSFLVFAHSIYTKEENRSIFTFYFPKGVLMTALWIVTVVSFIMVSLNKQLDTVYSFEESTYHNYITATIVTLLALYVLQLLYYIVRGIGMMSDLPTKYSSKFKVIYGVTLFVLFIAIAASVISYSLGNLTSFLFLASHALLNLWPFALAIFFLPSNEKHIGEDRDEIRILQGADDEDDEEEEELELENNDDDHDEQKE